MANTLVSKTKDLGSSPGASAIGVNNGTSIKIRKCPACGAKFKARVR